MNFVGIGILLIFVGFILVFLGSLFGSGKSNVQSAGGVFIGPFPLFGWASNPVMFYVLLVVALILFIVYWVLR